MAKFGRYDPRNKKQGRNKERSIYKDIRIKNVVEERENPKNWIKGIAWTTNSETEEDYEDDQFDPKT
jgi:hypothetical protein